jgi:hypothetical protein
MVAIHFSYTDCNARCLDGLACRVMRGSSSKRRGGARGRMRASCRRGAGAPRGGEREHG